MITSRERNAAQNHNIKAGNKSFETLANYEKQLQITCRKKLRTLHSRTACYHSVENVLSARFLSKTEIKTYIIFMFWCMGVKLGLSSSW